MRIHAGVVLLALIAVHCSTADAQTSLANSGPPVPFVTDIGQAQLPVPPDGYVWHLMEEIQAAVITPADWKRHAKNGPNARVVAFTPQPLNQNNQFEIGLTARLLWHPQLRAGNESISMNDVLGSIVRGVEANKVENTVLRGTVEDRAGKKMLILRHRNAPATLPPIVVHTVAIGDPLTGLVYEFIFESPESKWEESWKIAEPIFRRILILFQRG